MRPLHNHTLSERLFDLALLLLSSVLQCLHHACNNSGLRKHTFMRAFLEEYNYCANTFACNRLHIKNLDKKFYLCYYLK